MKQQNKFIVSSKGFFSDIIFDKVNGVHSIEWVQNLQKAKGMTSKQCQNLINKYKIDAFIYSPFKEFKTDKCYKIKIRNSYYDFSEEEEHDSLEYYPIKQYLTFNDVHFLNNMNEELYTYDEALKICIEKNTKMILELQTKLEKQLKEIEKNDQN